MAEELDVPYINEMFGWYTRTGDPSELRLGFIDDIDNARFSLLLEEAMKHWVNLLFTSSMQLSNQKNPLLPLLNAEKEFFILKIVATSRDGKNPNLMRIKENVLYGLEHEVLTRTHGDNRERMMQRYPGYVEQQATTIQAPMGEMDEMGQPVRAKKKGLFRW